MTQVTTNDFQSGLQIPFCPPHLNLNSFKNGLPGKIIEEQDQLEEQLHQVPKNHPVAQLVEIDPILSDVYLFNEFEADIDELAYAQREIHHFDDQNESLFHFRVLNRSYREENVNYYQLNEFGTISRHELEDLCQRVYQNEGRENSIHPNILYQNNNFGNLGYSPTFIAYFTDDIDTKAFTNDNEMSVGQDGQRESLLTESDEGT